MSSLLATFVLSAASVLSPPVTGADARAHPESSGLPKVGAAPEPEAAGGLRGWLTRPVAPSARFLDHGVLAVSVAGGAPHLYRLDARVGVLDHLSLGVAAHWLPGQARPQVWPVVAIAAWRGPMFEIGAHYRPVLHPPAGPETFTPQTHMGLGSLVLGAGWFSAGLDVGVAHTRVGLPDLDQPAAFQRRTAFGGGIFARVGTRRWGFTADALAVLTASPLLVIELALDLRFGAFELRDGGGWGWR